MYASSTSGWAFAYFTVQYCIGYRVQYLYFKPRMSGSKCEGSSDVADIVLSRHHWIIFFKRVDRTESMKIPEPDAINIRHQWNCSLPSVSHC